MTNNNILTKKIVFSCFLSSCLEIYDFAIFGFLTATIYKNYLSFLDKNMALIVTYAFFAVGFLFRPMGSLIFGYIGDVYGRKLALVTSVSMMGFASVAMFLLPSYDIIGVLSCYIIILIRIIQGVSVGGEFTGAIIFAVEHSKKNKAGLVAAIVSAGGACGVLLASFVSKILQNPSLPEYSWRFAFLIGFILAAVGYFIRNKLSDTPLFKKITDDKKDKIPLLEGLKFYKIECFATLWVAASNGAVFYFGTVYLVKFIEYAKPGYNGGFVPALVATTVAVFLPIFGIISDKTNRKIFLIFSSLIMGSYILIALNLISIIQSENILIFLIFFYAVLAAMMISSVNILAIEIFPVKYRMSCCSLFYSLGMGIIGGTVPMVSSYIISTYGIDTINLSMYIAIICFISALSVYLVYIKHKKAFDIKPLEVYL